MRILIAAVLLGLAGPVHAQTATPTPAPVFQRQLVEIYRIAPGRHEEFLRFIARADEVNRMAGLPPRQLYVHSDGAEWDFMLIQPAETPKDKAAASDAAWEKLNMPSGADFFFEIRKYIQSHSDTFVRGPTTATDFLASKAK